MWYKLVYKVECASQLHHTLHHRGFVNRFCTTVNFISVWNQRGFKKMGSIKACTPNMKKVLVFQGLISGERGGIRTLGHLIKSQVLYQLSYALSLIACEIFYNTCTKMSIIFFTKAYFSFFRWLFIKYWI